MKNIELLEKRLKAMLCHVCNGTTMVKKHEPCQACRGEGVLTINDNKRLALLWQSAHLN